MARGTPDVPATAGKVLDAALRRLLPKGKLGLAVSGGPDSLALLLLAATRCPGGVRVATVDHGLRAGSAEEAVFVAARCADLGVCHDTLTVAVAPGASLQAQARDARYSALADWAVQHGLDAVATAHHADDQAETLLMRLARGSGVGGLRGIREERLLAPGVRLVRPLLACRKAALEGVVSAAGWTAIDDPNNRDSRHDRTRARALLAANDWLHPERLARSAIALGEADDALDAQLRALIDQHLKADASGVSITAVHAIPRELRRRLLVEALDRAGASPSGPEVDRLLTALEEERTVTIGTVMLSSAGDGWRLEPAPPRRRT